MMLYLVGVVDDLIGVSYQAKFMVQIVCALLFPVSGLWIHDLSGLFFIHTLPAWIGIPLTVFMVVYITNAINLIDGLDGLAAGICFVALLTLGLAAVVRDQHLFMIVAFGMLGILLPFWIFNVFGNATTGKKIFMGDTGALTLGYLVSFLFIYMASGAGCTFPREMLIISSRCSTLSGWSWHVFVTTGIPSSPTRTTSIINSSAQASVLISPWELLSLSPS